MISNMNVALNIIQHIYTISVKSFNMIICPNLYNMSVKRCAEKRSIQVKRTPLY